MFLLIQCKLNAHFLTRKPELGSVSLRACSLFVVCCRSILRLNKMPCSLRPAPWNANRQPCPLFSPSKKIRKIRRRTWAFCMNAFPISRRATRPRCLLICVHFRDGKERGAVILWESPFCLSRSPTINPAELKAGHHTDSVRWGG